MKILVQIVLLHILISLGGIACSADEVIIRTQAEPKTPWVGQKVILTIDVLARDSWAAIDNFPLLEVPGVHLRRYETQGTRLNENNSGASYSGQRYEVLLFPHQAGELIIDSFSVEVTVKSWGADAEARIEKLATEPLSLTVAPQEGVAPGEYHAATNKFEAKQTWVPGGEEYQTGDAIERTVTRKGEDVSAMLFPPFELDQIEGMSCYPAQPEVNDSFNRGVLTGSRVDRLNCMFERAGGFTFPDITVSYWNMSTKKVESILLPGFSITVNDSGQGQGTAVGEPNPVQDKSMWLRITAVAGLCLSLYFLLKKQMGFVKKWQEKRKNSEKYLFKQVGKALRDGEPYNGLAAVMRWLDQLPGLPLPARLTEFSRRCGDEELVAVLKNLSNQTNWTKQQGLSLYGALSRGRKKYFSVNHFEQAIKQKLPPVGLNQ